MNQRIAESTNQRIDETTTQRFDGSPNRLIGESASRLIDESQNPIIKESATHRRDESMSQYTGARGEWRPPKYGGVDMAPAAEVI